MMVRNRPPRPAPRPKPPPPWVSPVLLVTGLIVMTLLLGNIFGVLGSKPSSVTSPHYVRQHDPNESRAQWKARWESERTAAGRLGFLHGIVTFPLFILWLDCSEKLLNRLYGKHTDSFNPAPRPWMGTHGIFILCFAMSVALFRYGWLPLVDTLWDALGGTPVDYGQYTGRRRGKGSGDPQANGVLFGYFAGMGAFQLWLWVQRQIKTPR